MNGRPPYKKDLRLVGAGHSHIIVIKRLGMAPVPGIRITLISDDTHAPYSGMLPGLIAGHYSFDDCHIDLRKLCQWAGVQFIRSTVKRLDPMTKNIICHQYPSLRYDLLSINIGSQPALNTIRGTLAHGYAVKPVKQFLNGWHQWIQSVYSSNRQYHIVMVGGGAAGVEVLLAMHYKLCNTTPIHARFTLVCADKHLLQSHNKHAQKFFTHHCRTLGIEIITGKRVIASTANHLLLDDHTSLNADFVAWAINAEAQTWPMKSGLKCDGKGFIQVDRYLCSVSHPDIFAVGDSAAFMPTPLPKAGVYAVRQGPILAHNLIATFQQQSLRPFKPQHRFLSLLTTGNRHAIASHGPLFASGKWVWRWKNHIDQAFMARFNPTPMPVKNDFNGGAQTAMRCGGCGAKVSRDILQNVLTQLTVPSNPDIISGQGDDAAIINPPSAMQWIQSVDFFRSFIDDAYLFGRIAAIHSLGDIYAMGGKPHSALVTAIIPYNDRPIMQETLLHLMQGALTTLNEENTTLIGGHSGEGPEMAFGLTVNGTLIPGQALTKTGLLPGDNLIITKPLGSGVLLAANMTTRCQGRWLDDAFTFMLQSNRAAVPILRLYGARSCTDVTGFGLLGHLQEMLTASQCNATIALDAIPVMQGAQYCSSQGIQSTLYPANKQSSGCQHYTGRHPSYPLLFDPQTAGGLLVGIPAQSADECLHALTIAGYTAAKIGTIDEQGSNALITFNG